MEAAIKKSGLDLMREKFPANQISHLPKGGVLLAFVGHAALTDRLLDCDPSWFWEPLAMNPDGLPVMDSLGGMWIRLTVFGVTRLGYGHAGTKEGGDAIKEVIGDALRNAAMRFGAALDLWHKGELHKDTDGALEKVLEASIEIEQAKQKRQGVMGAVLEDIHLDDMTKQSLSKLAARIAPMPPSEAYQVIEDNGLEADEKLWLWSLLDSKMRSALKRERETRSLTKEHA